MDDQNQTNQPLVPGTTPAVPSVPEDITPVESPAPITTTTTTTTSTMEPITTPVEAPIAPATPWTSPTEPVSMPTPSTEPVPMPEEIAMPAGKPKKKLMPIIGGVLALLLVVGVAGAAYYVSNQLSTRQAVAPTAPESKPMAGGVCDGTEGKEYGNCDEPHCVANTCIRSCCRKVNNVYSCALAGNQCFVVATGCTGCGGGGEEPPTSSCTWSGHTCTTDSQCYSGYAAGDTCYDVKCSSAGKCVGADEMTCDPWYWGDCKVACGETSKKQFQPCRGGGETYTREGYGENGGADCTEDNACKELVCKVTDRDSPINPKTITFPQAGTVRVFTWSMNGTLTLTSGTKTVTMQSTYPQGDPAQLLATELEVTAGQTYTVKVQLTGEGGDAYGWIPVKPNNTCGPVKKPANTTTAGCGENKDISSVINKTNEPANNIQSIVSTQCWGDKLQGDATQDYDFNDFAIVFAYEEQTSQQLSLEKKAYRNMQTNFPRTYDYSDEIVAGQTVSPDEVFVYRLNIGTEPKATTADILDNLPPQLTFVDAVSHCTENANSVVCNDVPLDAGDGDGWVAFRVKVKSGVADGTIIHNVGKLTVNGSTVEAVKDIPVDVPAGLVGACMSMNIYKKVGDEYQMMFLSDEELQKLKIGDLLKFSVLANVSGLRARFRVSIGDVPGVWLDGTVDANNPKLFLYTDYPVDTAGTYRFESEVSTAP